MAFLIDTLQGIVGVEQVLLDGDLSAYTQDWRKRAAGRALAVVRPADTQQVAAVVHACSAQGVSIVPQGGNTGLVLGSIPDSSGQQVVLSLRRMQAVRDMDRSNATVTVEAGCVLQNLQDEAERAGLLFPLSLAAEGSCTIGGNLATNAGGTQVLRYGNARDLCLGLEVVTAQGEIWNGLSGLRKDNTGYDLRDLFIGSEGTLGIITAATLKLYPKPLAQMTAWAAVPSVEAAVALLALAQQRLGAGLTGFELMGQFALSLVARHFPEHAVPLLQRAPFCVLMENSDFESEAHAREQFERLLEIAIEQGHVLDAVLAENIKQARQLWHFREQIPLAQAQEGPNIKHDISIPVSSMAIFCRETDALLERAIPGVCLVNLGHLGDGNLHYNVQAPDGGEARVFMQEQEERVNQIVYASVQRFAGSISAEHGVGSLKIDKLVQFKSPVALELMRALKRALDPHNLLNPGRVVRP